MAGWTGTGPTRAAIATQDWDGTGRGGRGQAGPTKTTSVFIVLLSTLLCFLLLTLIISFPQTTTAGGAGRARAERDVTVADGKSNVERRAGRLEEEVGRQSSGEHGGG